MRTSTGLAFAWLFVLALLMWEYYAHARQLMDQRLTAGGFPARNVSDLYPRWLGARELLLHGRDPYSAEITREIQRGYYGRPIDPGRATDPIDEQRFAYPLFVVFLLAPTVTLPFTLVQPIFAVVLFAAAVCSILLWTKVLKLKFGRYTIAAWLLITLGSIPFAEGIQLQQLSVLVAFFLAGAVYAVAAEKHIIAGVLLAASTIKPQLSTYVILCVLLWSMGQWRARRGIAMSFLTALVVLILASLILIPRWPVEFRSGIGPYLRYTRATTGVHELFGPAAGTLVLLFLASVAVRATWRAKSKPADSDAFRLAISLVLVFTCIAIPSLAAHNQVLLSAPGLLLVVQRRRIWSGGRIARSLWLAACLAFAWPWGAGSILATSLLFGQPQTRLWALPFATNPLIPITMFVALTPLLIETSGGSRRVDLVCP